MDELAKAVREYTRFVAACKLLELSLTGRIKNYSEITTEATEILRNITKEQY